VGFTLNRQWPKSDLPRIFYYRLSNKMSERYTKKLQENMLIILRDIPSVENHGYSARLSHKSGSSFLRQFCAPCYSCSYITRIYVE
jgi:hypothetical protein